MDVDMHDLLPGTMTMDSREIAELTNKNHGHVCRDIQEMLGRLNGLGQSSFGSSYTSSQGKEISCYKLPYRETMILVSGYSIELRARVVDRWLELEKKNAAALPNFSNPAEAARAWAAEYEAKKIAQDALAIAAPKVESFYALQRSDGSMSITEASKHFGLHPKKQVIPYLRDHKYLTSDNLPSQSALDAQYLAQRQARCTDNVFRPQACVLQSQLETWRTRVVPQIAAWEKKE